MKYSYDFHYESDNAEEDTRKNVETLTYLGGHAVGLVKDLMILYKKLFDEHPETKETVVDVPVTSEENFKEVEEVKETEEVKEKKTVKK